MTTGERGSLVIAMAVVLVLSGLGVAVLARTVSAIGSARVAQDDAAAASAADAGITDALYRIDHDAVPDDGPFPAGIGPVSGVAGTGRFSWTATVSSAAQLAIRSVGTVNGRQHQVDAEAHRAARWPWVLATAGSFVLDGTSSITGRIGSAGPMTLAGGDHPPGSPPDLLGPGGACSGCAAPNVLTTPVTFPSAAIPTSPPPLPCPGNPIAAIPAGTYLCTADVTFGRDGALGGPVVIYQQNGPSGLGAPTAIHFGGVDVNRDGVPADLVIHKVGPGVIDPGQGRRSGTFTGILDAPAATLDSANCQFGVTGAMVLGSFSCTSGGPGPTLTYGAGDVLAQAWQIDSHRDAPVGSG